jgi:DNA polymerase III epsilon subunit-like protein
VAVIDFETTGLSPAQGDRATEIAAVILENGKVVDRYQSLMSGERKRTNCPHESLKNHFLGDGAIASYVVRFPLT